MSAWITIANAVAEKYGVEDELFVRDRIGSINEDRMNDRDVAVKTFKSGQEAVQFGGKGVGGNAVARFGVDDGSEGDMSKEAAVEFAGIIDLLKDVGLSEEVLVGDDLNFKTLAEGFGATFSKEIINPANSNFDQDRDFTKTFENSQVVDIDYQVQLNSSGIGGGGTRTIFETEEQRDAFLAAIEEGDSAEILGVKGGDGSGTYNALAEDNGAYFSRDTFTFKTGVEIGDDPDVTFREKEIEEFGWTVQVGGSGVGGNASAKFNTEAEALAFEALVDQFIDLGLTDELFG